MLFFFPSLFISVNSFPTLLSCSVLLKEVAYTSPFSGEQILHHASTKHFYLCIFSFCHHTQCWALLICLLAVYIIMVAIFHLSALSILFVIIDLFLLFLWNVYPKTHLQAIQSSAWIQLNISLNVSINNIFLWYL